MAALWGFVRAGWKPLLFVVAVGMVLYYRASLIKTEASLTNVNRALKLAKDDIEDMQRRQRDVAALDAKYTKDLADAQKNIAQLELDVAAGRKRLQLNATCPANGAPGTTRVDDGAGPRLTDSAERDYFTLRSRIEIVTRQLTGLQEYVREQCLKQRISGYPVFCGAGYPAVVADEARDAVAVLHDAACRCADRAGLVKVMLPAHSILNNVRFEREADMENCMVLS